MLDRYSGDGYFIANLAMLIKGKALGLDFHSDMLHNAHRSYISGHFSLPVE